MQIGSKRRVSKAEGGRGGRDGAARDASASSLLRRPPLYVLKMGVATTVASSTAARVCAGPRPSTQREGNNIATCLVPAALRQPPRLAQLRRQVVGVDFFAPMGGKMDSGSRAISLSGCRRSPAGAAVVILAAPPSSPAREKLDGVPTLCCLRMLVDSPRCGGEDASPT